MKRTFHMIAALMLAAGSASAGSLESLKSSAADSFAAAAEQAPYQVPAAPVPARDNRDPLAEYYKYYGALEHYSQTAYLSPQESPEYLEAAAAGRYLRLRLEALEAELGAPPSRDELDRLSGRNKAAPVAWEVKDEIGDVLGLYGGLPDKGPGTRGVAIKAGYCQVNYVKNNTPFLVQYDGFLNKGEVILTFDDGPGQLTEEVAAAMKAGNAPSLFFVLGSKLGASGKALIKNSAAAGHENGVHGYWHATESGKPFTALSGAETLRQLRGVKESITGAAGKAPRFFRPPYGIISPDVLKSITSELGLIPVGWTIDSMDWSTKDPDALFKNTVSMIQKRGKGIVLLHDIHPQSRTAAKRLVKWLADNGYKVVSPDRLAKAFLN
ncbi:MAG TPA: hypothetical protein DEQ38_02090 [Elusimicrobia bacterium]|nr:hypothetical protein [Elusimicrobiota bacterium]